MTDNRAGEDRQTARLEVRGSQRTVSALSDTAALATRLALRRTARQLGDTATRDETDCRGSPDGRSSPVRQDRAVQKNKARRTCPILSPWPSRGFHGLAEKHIDSYIWALVGGALGGLAGALQADKGHVYRIESVLVGVFGAFVGGDFLVAMLFGPAAGMGIGLGMAVLGAVVMLALLSVMRRAVGPLRPAKKRTGTRR